MDFWIRFYCLLAFITLQILAFDPNSDLSSASSFTPNDDSSEILKKTYLRLIERTKTTARAAIDSGLSIEGKTASSNAQKLLDRKLYFSWWPSKVHYSDTINEVLEATSFESRDRDADKPAATFEELENQNANIYNPLLNLDKYPIPSKRYTFVELEDMNANRYNPLLD